MEHGETCSLLTFHPDHPVKVALMHYQSVEEACRMVNSVEYAEVVKYKVEGLLDTHTYLTHQII